MKKRLARNEKSISIKNLSIAAMLGLAFMGVTPHQAQAENLPLSYSNQLADEGAVVGNSLTNAGEGSMQIDIQTVKRVKKSLASGKST